MVLKKLISIISVFAIIVSSFTTAVFSLYAKRVILDGR